MFCGQCGKELKEGQKICDKCGVAIGEPKLKDKSQIIAAAWTAAMGLLIIATIIVCVVYRQGGFVRSNSTDSKNDKKIIQDSETNKVGNSYANLNAGGRVTGQGDTIYFWEDGYIYRKVGNKENEVVCKSKNAKSLQVIGDTLYYLEDDSVYSIKINGEEKQLLVTKVCRSPFIVYENNIYYVTYTNVSASEKKYSICKYSIDEQKVLVEQYFGSTAPRIVGINENYDDALMYYYQTWYVNYDPDKRENVYEEVWRLETAELGGKIFNSIDSVYCELVGEEYIYIGSSVGTTSEYKVLNLSNYEEKRCKTVRDETFADAPKFLGIVNCYGNDVIMYWWKDDKDQLVLTSEEKFFSEPVTGRVIVKEDFQIYSEVCVVGDYVYYSKAAELGKGKLYRIKIDGTGWEELSID